MTEKLPPGWVELFEPLQDLYALKERFAPMCKTQPRMIKGFDKLQEAIFWIEAELKYMRLDGTIEPYN